MGLYFYNLSVILHIKLGGFMTKTANQIEITKNEVKQKRIIEMFNAISPSYDKVNHILSFGIDKLWRNSAVKKALSIYKSDIDMILDVACGTGDLTNRWKEALRKNKYKNADVIGLDLSEKMLKIAKKKFNDISFIQESATSLPFEDNSIDIVSIAYGIRNIPQMQDALKEFHRVLKKGGLLVILEFMKDVDEERALLKLKHLYMQHILPFVGGMISRNKGAYNYLRDSISNFVTPKEMENALSKCGFNLEFSNHYTMNMSHVFMSKKL